MPKSMKPFVRQGIKSFDTDPADTAFQRGYLTALLDAWEYAIEDDGFTKPYRDVLQSSKALLPDVTLN